MAARARLAAVVSEVAMRVLGVASTGVDLSEPPCWVEAYDIEAFGGRGTATLTNDPAKALRFPTAVEAMAAWTAVSRTRPVRGDGKPNRPLTAYTIEVSPMPKEYDARGKERA